MELTDDILRYESRNWKGKIRFILSLDGWTEIHIVQDCKLHGDEFFRCTLIWPEQNPLYFIDVKYDDMDELVEPYENITLEIVGPYRWKIIRE